MKILTFSTLFPNGARPSHGIFVETRLRHLLHSGRVEARVVAPVPWFPFAHPRYGDYAINARAPREEERHGIRVVHPRYPVLPKIGMTIAPMLLTRAVERLLRQIVRDGYDFDLIDAHYFYPDGVAAVMLGRMLNKPVVITARGTDLTLIPRYAMPRRMIQWAAARAAAMITVSASLKNDLVALGVPPARVQVLRNGVDLELFRPLDRASRRAELGLLRRTLLSVGHLIPRKGHDLVIRALLLLPAVDLIIAGDGPEGPRLKSLAAEVGVAERVRFTGALSQSQLRGYYGAVDALILASSREGWANVLLESMACGTPVVATRVGGTPEVVQGPAAGILTDARTSADLARGVDRLFASYPAHTATRAYAEKFGWEETTAGQIAIFERIINRRPDASSAG